MPSANRVVHIMRIAGGYQRSTRRIISIFALSAMAACNTDNDRVASAAADGASPDVVVTVRDGDINMPDTVTAGWRHIRVTESGESHIVVFFRMPAEWSDAELKAFRVALDTSPNTPTPAIALGGPEIGTSGDVLLELTPGRYVVACVGRGQDSHRHAISGEARVIVAIEPPADTPTPEPVAGLNVDMTDFAYRSTDVWSAGQQMLRVVNSGRQDHQIRIARLSDGVTIRDLMSADDPSSLMHNIAGVARMSTGQVAFIPLELEPGEYLLSCLVADVNSKRPHVELGMMRTVTVR